MSSDLEFIALLSTIQINLYRYGGPILMTLGTVSSVLSLLVFTQKTLRKNPCSIYFIAYNVSNLLLIYTSTFSMTLSTGYAIDPSSYNLIFCRCRFYAILLFDVLSPSYLILASIDRVFVTSTNALTRQRSTSRLAYRYIAAATLFWLLGHTHTLIFNNLLPVAPGVVFCYFQPGAHLTAMSYYSLLIKATLIPLLMITFGIWTVKNVRSLTRINLVPVFTGTGSTGHARTRTVQTKDRQLIRMLLIDTSVYIIFNNMSSIVLLYQEITKYQSRSFARTQLEAFILIVSVFSTYIPYCVGCYTNLLISKTFRHEVKNILLCK